MANLFDVKNSEVVSLIKRIIREKDVRDKAMLYASTAVNYFFVVFQLYGGIRYKSAWFTALGVYYTALTSVRLYIGLSNKKYGGEAWKVFHISGWVLVLANLALVAIVSIMVAVPAVAMYGYSPIMAAGVTVWTFYLLVSAIVGIAKQWKNKSPIVLAENGVQLIGAAVSILMLQTAMIASYGTQVIEKTKDALAKMGETMIPVEVDLIADDLFQTFVTSNRVTGMLVLLIVLIITAYMITKGNIEYRKTKKQRGKIGINTK